MQYMHENISLWTSILSHAEILTFSVPLPYPLHFLGIVVSKL